MAVVVPQAHDVAEAERAPVVRVAHPAAGPRRSSQRNWCGCGCGCRARVERAGPAQPGPLWRAHAGRYTERQQRRQRRQWRRTSSDQRVGKSSIKAVLPALPAYPSAWCPKLPTFLALPSHFPRTSLGIFSGRPSVFEVRGLVVVVVVSAHNRRRIGRQAQGQAKTGQVEDVSGDVGGAAGNEGRPLRARCRRRSRQDG